MGGVHRALHPVWVAKSRSSQWVEKDNCVDVDINEVEVSLKKTKHMDV
jgi:hypothetical protein